MAANNPTPDAAPKKQGRIKQIIEVLKVTQEVDKTTIPWMIGSFLVTFLLFTLIFGYFGHPIYGGFLGLIFGILIALIIMARKAEASAYARIRGQKGAALAAMQSIRRGWNVEEQPCALDPRTQDMVFRASGRAGIALVIESGTARAHKLLNKEASRLEKLLPNVPIHKLVVGDGDDQIPLHKLASKMQRMRNELTKEEAGEVAKRLRAMPNPVRLAMPKGVDPMRSRPSRKTMIRGR